MADQQQLSKEEKEAFINAKMEKIRKRNEELMKRYHEVEADKLNAELLSQTAIEHKTTSPGTQNIRVVNRPQSQNTHAKNRQHSKQFQQQQQQQTPRAEDKDRQRPQRLSEGDGPPPDPVYSFLSDRTREGRLSDKQQGSRRHQSNYGGQDFSNVKSSLQYRRNQEKEKPRYPPRNKMEMALCMTGKERRDYQQWREERSRVEEERLSRQKTASGEWRREWDREKLEFQDEPMRSSGCSNKSENQDGQHGRRNWRNRDNNRGWHKNSGPPRRGHQQGSSDSFSTENYFKENTEDWRKVDIQRDSLQISVVNDIKNTGGGFEQSIGYEQPDPLHDRVNPQRKSSDNANVEKREILNRSGDNSAPRNRNKISKEHRVQIQNLNEPKETATNVSIDNEIKDFANSNSVVMATTDNNKEIPAEVATSPVENASGTQDSWEGAGDESWEDLTSGNESLELSQPNEEAEYSVDAVTIPKAATTEQTVETIVITDTTDIPIELPSKTPDALEIDNQISSNNLDISPKIDLVVDDNSLASCSESEELKLKIKDENITVTKIVDIEAVQLHKNAPEVEQDDVPNSNESGYFSSDVIEIHSEISTEVVDSEVAESEADISLDEGKTLAPETCEKIDSSEDITCPKMPDILETTPTAASVESDVVVASDLNSTDAIIIAEIKESTEQQEPAPISKALEEKESGASDVNITNETVSSDNIVAADTEINSNSNVIVDLESEPPVTSELSEAQNFDHQSADSPAIEIKTAEIKNTEEEASSKAVGNNDVIANISENIGEKTEICDEEKPCVSNSSQPISSNNDGESIKPQSSSVHDGDLVTKEEEPEQLTVTATNTEAPNVIEESITTNTEESKNESAPVCEVQNEQDNNSVNSSENKELKTEINESELAVSNTSSVTDKPETETKTESAET